MRAASVVAPLGELEGVAWSDPRRRRPRDQQTDRRETTPPPGVRSDRVRYFFPCIPPGQLDTIWKHGLVS